MRERGREKKRGYFFEGEKGERRKEKKRKREK